MRRARVLNHGHVAGVLEEAEDRFRFTYTAAYLASELGPISLSLPKRDAPFVADVLFPFFFGLLTEGGNRALQHRTLRIDESDHMGLLLATAVDPIGSVSVEPLL